MASAASYPKRWPTIADRTNANSGATVSGTGMTWSSGGEAFLTLARDHDRRRFVGAIDRDLLRDVVGGAARQAGRAYQDQRLARQVDVLLVLGDVARDRLVAELRQLDPHLLRRHPVGTVADHRPVAAPRGEALRGVRDGRALLQHLGHGVRQCAQRLQQLTAQAVGAEVHGFGDRAGEQHARGHL